MGLLSAVTPKSDSAHQSGNQSEETFAYRCGRCDTRFERPKSQMTRIECPECGSGGVHVADEDE